MVPRGPVRYASASVGGKAVLLCAAESGPQRSKVQLAKHISTAVRAGHFEKVNFGGCTVIRSKWNFSLRILHFIFCAACLLSSPDSARCQAINATLSGKITDASGGSIAKATVTASNVATGFSRSAPSSDNGEYSVPALPAGEYKVIVEFSGFGKQTKNITLQVGQAAELGFTLSPGEIVQKVEVEATSELAEPTRTQVSTVIT